MLLAKLTSEWSHVVGRRHTFDKAIGNWDITIQVQKHRYNTKSSVSFAVNILMMDRQVVAEQTAGMQAALQRWGTDIRIIRRSGSLHTDLGRLMGEDRQKWWSYTDREGMELAASEILAAVNHHGIVTIRREVSQPILEPSYYIVSTASSHWTADGHLVMDDPGGQVLWPPGQQDT